MKIASINTLTHGGAAIVAMRIHQSLLELNVDALLVTKYGANQKLPNHRFFKNATAKRFLRNKLSHPLLFTLAKAVLSIKVHPNIANRPDGFEIFSPIYSRPNTELITILEDTDIIHLHWINDFIDYSTFFKQNARKKFIWTLHDMNPITGGCHHSDGCLKFETSCIQCPQLKNTIDEDYSFRVQQEKIAGMECLNDDQLVIVSPSDWLSELSKKSRVTKRFRHVVIPNPSFTEGAFTETRESIREKLNLPKTAKIVLFASDNLGNPRKGIDLLFNAVRLIPRRDEILLIGIGHKARAQKQLEVLYTGNITNKQLLAEYFYCADIFVTPSLAENSPLVVIEAISCGTPVAGSCVGGIPDLIDETNGVLFSSGNFQALANAIQKGLFEINFDRAVIQQNARNKYHPTTIGQSYLKVYKELLK